MTSYMDCNATTPVDPRVRELVLHFLAEEYGNAGSRTHEFGARAKRSVEHARRSVAAVVAAEADEVVFTSGATESNNLALLGLAEYAEQTGRRHIVSTTIEHKAVLEPLEALRRRGFDLTLVAPTASGAVAVGDVTAALRKDTVLVSLMHSNNETGVLQPVAPLAEALNGHSAFLHVDAAQTFGKELETLRLRRIDLISISGHKIFGPKGVGALITRRRGFERVPLTPLMFGGGQERSLRPGTLPVALIAALGLAAELAVKENAERRAACLAIRSDLLRALEPLAPLFHGRPDLTQPHVLNFSIAGIDSEAAILALKDVVAISNGSACTSSSYSPSHVLVAMGLSKDAIDGALRLSWSHLTTPPDWGVFTQALSSLR